MLHPDTELRFINQEIGYGVVATKFIPQGTITWVLDLLDRKFTLEEIAGYDRKYREIIDKYCFRNACGDYILCWDHGRFINHSYKPTCITTAYDFELAVRDIYPGQQLTNDYGTLNIEEPFYCLPEEGVSRKAVMPDDLLNYYHDWDSELSAAFKYLETVEQPLAGFLPGNIVDKALGVARGEVTMDSVLSCYCGKKISETKHLTDPVVQP